MFSNLFFGLKAAKLPVTLKEYLALLDGVRAGVADFSVDDFYYLSRAALVKDERNLDKFDRVFAEVFKGLERSEVEAEDVAEIPEEWLRKVTELYLTEEEKQQIQALGGWEKLMDTLRQRLDEQQGRHQGGSKWIGTAGTSPFGAYGYNPEGVRIGQEGSRNRRAVKVWDRRDFRNLDDTVQLGTRNIKVALRRLRRFAREGAETELDLPGTIGATARRGGMLDIKLVPERHNTVKVLLFLDVGGSMDPHVRLVESLFSAARSEFKHLEYFYFHNCPYETVWRDNRRRHAERMATWDVIHTFPKDYRVIFVGDAAMSPYELAVEGGSVEHWNEETGQAWLSRILNTWGRSVWINPNPETYWKFTGSTQMVLEQMEGRMFPLTLEGLDSAMRELSR